MSWRKILFFVLITAGVIQGALILDIYLNEDRTLELKEIKPGEYKANLFLRSIYVYEKPDGAYEINKFPSLNILDGINYGKNISSVENWAFYESEKYGTDRTSIIIPYDYSFLFTVRSTKTIVFDIEGSPEPLTLKYSIFDR